MKYTQLVFAVTFMSLFSSVDAMEQKTLENEAVSIQIVIVNNSKKIVYLEVQGPLPYKGKRMQIMRGVTSQPGDCHKCTPKVDTELLDIGFSFVAIINGINRESERVDTSRTYIELSSFQLQNRLDIIQDTEKKPHIIQRSPYEPEVYRHHVLCWGNSFPCKRGASNYALISMRRYHTENS